MKSGFWKLLVVVLGIVAGLHGAGVVLASAQALPTPPEIWEDYDPDAGAFREEIVSEKTEDGIYHRESYISAYVLGQEIRVYCKYSVKAGARNVPGLMNVHGWMGQPAIDLDYVRDGWAVLAHDYCGQSGHRPHYTRYPEPLRYGNMDAKVGYRVKSRLPDGMFITDPRQTDDYLWYAIQRRALSYLLAQKEVDPHRIGAKGYSYGGTLMWNLGTDPRVKAVVAYFGIGWLEYYRTRRVWMYNVPYVEPAKTPGEELYLAAIAPQAHAPYITAASLWLNGSNDHHGGHERGGQTFEMFRPGVPWSFAIQARGHHNTEKLGDDTRLWLEKHVLGKAVDWPVRPRSAIKLGADGVPELHVTPASAERVTELQAYYAVKNPVSFGRAWRDAESVQQDGVWVARLPVLNVDDYLFAFANLHYANNIVVSTDFEAVIPSQLGAAIATDTPSDVISEGTGLWSDVAAVEGVGGIAGFRALNNRWGTASEQFSDPKWQAPRGSRLSFRFYCTQPQNLVLEVNDRFATNFEITAADEWQSMTVTADQLVHRENQARLDDWSSVAKIRLKPQPGADITKVIFAEFKWAMPPAKPASAGAAEGRILRDVVYKTASGEDVHLDLYYPSKTTTVRPPVFYYLHGGGWYAGEKEDIPEALFTRLREQGVVCVSANYRLVNGKEVDDPVVMRDCAADAKDGLRFLKKNEDQFGLDLSRVVTAGSSAGAHLAMLISFSDRGAFVGDPELQDFSVKPLGCVSYSGPVDFTDSDLFVPDGFETNLDPNRFTNRIKKGVGQLSYAAADDDLKARMREVSPIYYLGPDRPAVLVIHGDRDGTIPLKHAHRLQAKGAELGLAVEVIEVQGAGHGLDGNYTPSAESLLESALNFVRQHLDPPQPKAN